MSISQKPPATDSTVEAQKYIEDIVQRDSEQKAEPAKPHRVKRTRLPELVALLVAMVALSSWNVFRISTRGDVFTRDEVLADAYLSLLFAADEVGSYHDSTGMFPIGLDIVEADIEDLRYQPLGDTYLLSVDVMDSTITYSHGEDVTPLEDAFSRLTVPQR